MKGGQSQRRYERERDMEVTYFFRRIAEHAAKEFLENHKVTALIVGGPGQTKDDFLKGDYLNYELKNALLSKVDSQSERAEAVKEILEKSSQTLKNMCAPEEKMIVQRLLSNIGKQNGLVGIFAEAAGRRKNRQHPRFARTRSLREGAVPGAVRKRQ